MAFFEWKESMSVGVSQFDEQHKKLVVMINDLFEAMHAGKASEVLGDVLLSGLIDYTQTHFANEERLMQLHSYPELAAHKQEHTRLTQKVMDLQAQHQAGKMALSIETSRFLREWLTQHIMHNDKKYGQFFNSKGIR